MPPSALQIAGYLRDTTPLVGPSTVQIDLTDACNQNCIVCWLHAPDLKQHNQERVERQASLPWDTYLSLIDELKTLGTSELYFAGGGEPLVHPRAWDALQAAVQRGFTTSLHTNFSLVDEDDIQRILDLGIHHLTISLWAGSPEAYRRTHPRSEDGDFERISGNIRLLNDRKEDRPTTKLYHVLTTHNAQELTSMFQLAEELGCDAVEFAVAETLPGMTDSHGLTPEDAAQLSEELTGWGDRAVWRRPRLMGGAALAARLQAITQGLSCDTDLVHQMPCFAGWTYSRVMADGRVIPCLKAHRIPSGNLSDSSFSEIWSGAKQTSFRRAGRADRKTDPLFELVGNEEGVSCGCERGCDNLAENQRTIARMDVLSRLELAVLRHAPKQWIVPGEEVGS